MQISIIIPAHNEAKYLNACLASFVAQTQPPDELIVVDDNSTDETYQIAASFATRHPWITIVQRKSEDVHIPGKKVVDTFNFGLQKTKIAYDLIGKFDADIILPPNYFEVMRNRFKANWLLGMCSGVLHLEKNGVWRFEGIANKNHVRGPIKLYYRQLFELMGGLKPGVGWDTVDTLLCTFHDFQIETDENLIVKHLRPTGHGYSVKSYQQKGKALYQMRYDVVLAKIALLKMALQAKSPLLYLQGIVGYLKAFFTSTKPFVTKAEGKYIRKHRWKGVLSKLRI
ncbi:glycosyltransferase [Croceivirga sp. JEA036]|uniref:glycosyltransferase n=1 Tax=Croceivirga sp. JEA036 TaxID=2721162 RepID=UPI001439FB8C|nr:glycosyltransferase [Croceivirga sp. JEA036]NJB37196.1 glycosyltransferase [Croceivirga sp. JEA036]